MFVISEILFKTLKFSCVSMKLFNLIEFEIKGIVFCMQFPRRSKYLSSSSLSIILDVIMTSNKSRVVLEISNHFKIA